MLVSSISYETPQFLNLRSQWKHYHDVESKTNGEMILPKPSAKSFFQMTSARSFSFYPFRVCYVETKGFMSCISREGSSSLLVVSPNDYIVNKQCLTVTIRPSRGSGWSMVLKCSSKLETEEVAERIFEIANVTPLSRMLSRDFGETFPKTVKAKVWDVLVAYNGPKAKEKKLRDFYTDTILNDPTEEQLQVVQELYNMFYRVFANGHPNRIASLPVGVVDNVTRVVGTALPPNQMEGAVVFSGKDLKENDAEAFVNLLLNAAKYDFVRAIFLWFNFDDNFVRDFNTERRARNLPGISGTEVLENILSQVVERSTGLWGSIALPVFMNLSKYPRKEKVPLRNATNYTSSSPKVHQLFPVKPVKPVKPAVAASSLTRNAKKPSPNRSNRHRRNTQSVRVVHAKDLVGHFDQSESSAPSAPPLDGIICGYEETKETKVEEQCMAKQYLDSPKEMDLSDATSSETPSETPSATSSDSDSTIDSLPTLDGWVVIKPNKAVHSVSEINSVDLAAEQVSFGSLREGRWLKNTKKKIAENMRVLTSENFKQFMDKSGCFVAKTFLLATKYSSFYSTLNAIPYKMAVKSFQVHECVGDNEDPRDASPIIAVLANTRMNNEDRQSLFNFVAKAKLCNDAFFRMFLRSCLTNSQKKNTRLIKSFMDAMFFSNNYIDYNIKSIRRVPHLGPILFEELCGAFTQNLRQNDDTVSVLIEYALRFENIYKNNKVSKSITIQQWIEDDEYNHSTQRRLQLFITYIRDNKYFRKWLSDIASPNVAIISCEPGVDKLQDLDLDFKQRRKKHMLNVLYGYFSTSLSSICQHGQQMHSTDQHEGGETKHQQQSIITETNVSASICHFLNLPKMAPFFTTYWLEICSSIVEDLMSYGVQPWYKEYIINGDILSRPEHFCSEVIHAIQASPDLLSDQIFQNLTLSSLKLKQYEQLVPRLHAVEHQIDRNDESIRQLGDIAMAILKRPTDEFDGLNLTIECIRDIANYAAAAKKIVSHQAKSTSRLQSAFNHYLRTTHPSAWKELFKSAKTIAFFIKYLDRENLSKAYTEYFDRNKNSKKMTILLKQVKKHFTKPFMSPQDFNVENGKDSKIAIESLINNLKYATVANSGGNDAMAMLKNLTAAWLRDRLDVVNVPMPPRNVQGITFLLASSWLKEKVRSQSGCTRNECSAFIAQVGTGEGKSLIIAMMACYAVKCLGKRVHVLENNQGLLQRDYENFKSFYQNMDVTTSNGTYSPSIDVVYILRNNIETSYRKRVFEGHVPAFPDTILIVDEVDELIVDGDPNCHYVKEDIVLSAGFAESVTAYTKNLSRPENVSYDTWEKAKRACDIADRKRENVDYRVTSDSVIWLDKRGRQVNYSDSWLEVLRQRLHGNSAKIKSHFFCQNISHMFSQYICIMGLSGSLGSPSERIFLEDVFHAEFVETPSFLNTCDGVTKHEPKLVSKSKNSNNSVSIFQNKKKQFDEVISLATEKQDQVPVVVICGTSHIAAELFEKIQRQTDNVQLLLEHDRNGRMDYNGIVDNATKPIEAGGAQKTWQITVTDYFGGRGHDYSIHDEDVDADGGLLMIALSIPESEREFIQWKGRTARSDRNGQYAIVLNREDEPLKGNEEEWEDHAIDSGSREYKETVINVLLSISDKKIKSQLIKLRKEIKGGQRLNELCDQFYKKHRSGSDGARPWPVGDAQIRLRDFLTDVHTSSVTEYEIAKFAKEVGIVDTENQYKALSRYN